MNALHKVYQLQTIEQQVRSFKSLGSAARMKASQKEIPVKYSVWLAIENKEYHFSDPNYDVIIGQLAHLYQKIKEGIN